MDAYIEKEGKFAWIYHCQFENEYVKGILNAQFWDNYIILTVDKREHQNIECFLIDYKDGICVNINSSYILKPEYYDKKEIKDFYHKLKQEIKQISKNKKHLKNIQYPDFIE